ncbi:MAG: chemotaxis protein CheB, partial [Phycisphaerales bacterium]|nr:chemotaxis protein CheB [Phycisphaerales bacterium]
STLTQSLSVPIIVAQHMPELFTRSLTTRLGNICSCGAKLAEKGVLLNAPCIYIAQGGKHLKPTRVAGSKLVARLIDEHPDATYKPSVDLLFEAAAEFFGSRLLAIQLTGMGEDGSRGAKAIRKVGGTVIAQEASSCVVYGMPKAVIESGSASAILTPSQIRGVLSTFCTNTATQEPQSGQSHPRMSA